MRGPFWFDMKVCSVFDDKYSYQRSNTILFQWYYKWFKPNWIWISWKRNVDTRIGRWKCCPCLLPKKMECYLSTIYWEESPIASNSFLKKLITWSRKIFFTFLPTSRIVSTLWRILSIVTYIFPGLVCLSYYQVCKFLMWKYTNSVAWHTL